MSMQNPMEENFYKSERQRYSKLLSLTYTDKYSHRIYKNLDKSLALLNEICELSETEKGRDQIQKIFPEVIRYYLIDTVKTQWYWRLPNGYKKVDNFILRIIVNLTTDLRFYYVGIKPQIKALQSTSNPTWNRLRNTILDNISLAEKRIKVETPLQQYKEVFESKEQAIVELNKHKDFFNFSGSSLHFEQQFPLYINMLRGALRVEAKSEVIHIFPKSCFGCVIFSMVNAGYRAHQQSLSVIFLRQLTGGWFTSKLYDCILIKMKELFHKLRRNQDLQDRYELSCLRFTQYDRSIYQYFNKLGSKDQKGQLAKSRKINSMAMFEEELSKLRYKQKMSDQCSQIDRNYRRKSISSKQFLDISNIVDIGQAAIIQQFVVNKMKTLGRFFQTITLKYSHDASMLKYNLKKFINYSGYHTLVLVRCKNGIIFGVYFSDPSTYQKLIGTAQLFTLHQIQCFNLGELSQHTQIIQRKQKKMLGHILQKAKNVQDEESFYSRRFENRQKSEYYTRIPIYYKRNSGSGRLHNDTFYGEQIGYQQNNQEVDQLSSQEEQKMENIENISHKLSLSMDGRIIEVGFSVQKQEKELADNVWRNFIDKIGQPINKCQGLVEIDKFEYYKLQGMLIRKE